MELKCSEYKLLQMKKDSLGIHNCIAYEFLVAQKLLWKAVHELEGLSSFPLHKFIQRDFE